VGAGIASRAADVLAQVAAVVLLGLLLAAVGQPVFTDDLWWHLSLGEAFATQGLGLADDPQLFAAAGPPSTSAWASDRSLAAVQAVAGFQGLRVLHVGLVAAIVALAWSLLRRASASALAASVAGTAFIAVSAYRLVQLRPHLATMLAVLLLYRLVLARGLRIGPLRLAAVALLLLVWANAHSGFVLGPLLLLASLAAVAASLPFLPEAERGDAKRRASGLTAALVLGSLATLANPAGLAPHRAWLAAGSETPDLLRVADEWLPVALFAWPSSDLPPSPLTWALVWVFVVAVPLLGVGALRVWRAGRSGIDPALLGLAFASLVAMLTAVRFTWLGIFPLLALVASARDRLGAPPARWLAAALAAAGAAAFVGIGAWPMISKGLSGDWRLYARPYALSKYVAHPVWVLRDAGLRGHAYSDYTQAGFVGYWLAPGLRVFVNGSLNVPPRVMEANRAIREHRGLTPDQGLAALLDAEEIDVFIGIRMPIVRTGARPVFQTTAWLERAAGWLPVFRNVDSAVYLRRDERNRDNVERLAAFYAEAGVPFDPERGFDPERVIRDAQPWAIRRGLVPIDFASAAAAAQGSPSPVATAARDRLASLYAALGLYEDVLRLDRRTLRAEPDHSFARRRVVWSLLHLDRRDEALSEATRLSRGPSDPLADELARAAEAYAGIADPREAAGFVAGLPLFSPAEARWLAAGMLPPEVRTR